jgi:hypothetical protein
MRGWSKWMGGPRAGRTLSHGPMHRTPTSRRAFLGGAGAVITLPFLESVARALPPAPPVRLVFWFVPDGMVMDQYRPSGDGALPASLPRILQPLQGLSSDLLVLSGLRNEAAMVPVAGDHARGTGSFLTCETVEHSTSSIHNGISADQVAASAIGDQTLFRSLELGTTGGSSVGDCDSGYSCAYTRNISWLDAETPNPKLTDPALLFDRMFSGFDDQMTAAELERRKRWRTSVLDTVTAEANSLHTRLSPSDQAKLDQYLTGVRELEVRVKAEVEVCLPGERPASGLDYPSACRAMSDLTVLAFQCDLTRVVTFMMENGGSNRSFDFLGINEGHHDLSHHLDDEGKIEKLAQIGTWEVGEFAYLLDQLRSQVDATGAPMLESSLCLLSSEISDGNRHNHDDLPVLLAGRGGGYVANPGRHKTLSGAPIADLYLAMLDAVGVHPGGFGIDGSQPMDLS